MLAVIYIGVAIHVVAADRASPGSGWISLQGMGAAIVTLPVTLLGETLGVKFNYQRNLDMSLAIGFCALFAGGTKG